MKKRLSNYFSTYFVNRSNNAIDDVYLINFETLTSHSNLNFVTIVT